MLPLFGQTIKKFRIAFITYTVISVLFMWMLVAMAPSILEKSDDFEKLLESYPEGMMKAVGVDTANVFSGGIEGFLSMEIYSFMWPIIAIIMIIAFASGTIAGEVDQGTIEVLLAQPMSRAKIFWSKFLAGIAIFLVFNVISIYSTIPFAWIYNVDYVWKAYHLLFLLSSGFGLALYGVTVLISSFSSSRSRTVTIAAGIVLVMYALNVLASLQESVEFLKYFSFFYYFDHQAVMVERSLDGVAMLIFSLVALITSVSGYFVFRRRDVAV